MTGKKETLALGCDHAGFCVKNEIKEYLLKSGFEVKDFGTFSEERVDYPDFIHPLAEAVNNGVFKRAVITCGSGNGVSMVANKYRNIRAALCWTPEVAKLARQHNDANILAIPARFVSKETAIDMLEAFLNTEFEGGRHAIRVNKISKP